MAHVDPRLIPQATTDSLPRAAAAAVIAILIAGVLVFGVALSTRGPGLEAQGAAREAIDGWSAYLGAPAARPAADVTDGWMASLSAAARTPVDGWQSYLAGSAGTTPAPVDGWMSRYGRADD